MKTYFYSENATINNFSNVYLSTSLQQFDLNRRDFGFCAHVLALQQGNAVDALLTIKAVDV